MPRRKSIRERKSAILDDYIIYLHKHEFDIGVQHDPFTCSEAMSSRNSEKWIDAMKDEKNSWLITRLGILSSYHKERDIGFKWTFKIKWDSNGNMERYKAYLIVKGFT